LWGLRVNRERKKGGSSTTNSEREKKETAAYFITKRGGGGEKEKGALSLKEENRNECAAYQVRRGEEEKGPVNISCAASQR